MALSAFARERERWCASGYAEGSPGTGTGAHPRDVITLLPCVCLCDAAWQRKHTCCSTRLVTNHAFLGVVLKETSGPTQQAILGAVILGQQAVDVRGVVASCNMSCHGEDTFTGQCRGMASFDGFDRCGTRPLDCAAWTAVQAVQAVQAGLVPHHSSARASAHTHAPV